QQRPAGAQHVFAESAPQRSCRMAGLSCVDEVRELKCGVRIVEQRDEEVLGIEQFADHRMHAPVELVLADVGGGQLRDLEQRRLQAFGALALDDLQLQ